MPIQVEYLGLSIDWDAVAGYRVESIAIFNVG